MPKLTALCAVMSVCVCVWFVCTCCPSNLCALELVHGVVPGGGSGVRDGHLWGAIGGGGGVKDGHPWGPQADLVSATPLPSLSTSPSLPFLCSNLNF